MAKFDIKELNYITCGKKQNTFNVSYCYTDDGHIQLTTQQKPEELSAVRTATLFGEIGEYSSMSQQHGSNTGSFYDIGKQEIIHNLYDSQKSLFKSTSKKPGTDENIDIFLPHISSDFINACQFENYAYALTHMTDKDPITLGARFRDLNEVEVEVPYTLSAIFDEDEFNIIYIGDIKDSMQKVLDRLNEEYDIATLNKCAQCIKWLYGKYSANLLFITDDLRAYGLDIEQIENYNIGQIRQIILLFILDFRVKVKSNEKIVVDQNTADNLAFYYQLSNDAIKTFFSPKPEEVNIMIGNTVSSYDEAVLNSYDLSDYTIQTIFNLKRNLKHVYHNYILEIPEGKMYNKYSQGFIQCDQVLAKNHLNYAYTLSADQNYNLSGCREYCNINVCGGQLYTTYRDNLDYKSDMDGYVEYVNIDSVNDTYDPEIYEYNLSRTRRSYGYQHVEVINQINRYDDATGKHKSSLFSLKLHDTGLNQSTIPENIKAKLRQNIRKNVRYIINDIIPANTQLFDIYFEGK